MDKESTIYEISYLLLPTLSPEEALERAEHVVGDIVKREGTIVSHEEPVSIPLAYTMVKVFGTTHQKFDNGYFGWVKFEMPADALADMKKHLDEDANILRYLLIKTVRENTLLHGHMMFKKDLSKEQAIEPEAEEKVETPVEDLDKSIDDLVIV